MHPRILNWNIDIVAVLTDFTNMAVMISNLLRNLTFNRSAHCTQVSDQCPLGLLLQLQWWFVYPDTFVPGRYFRINEFSGLLKRPSVQKRKSVPALFVRISAISGLSEPGLTNHHCTLLYLQLLKKTLKFLQVTWCLKKLSVSLD